MTEAYEVIEFELSKQLEEKLRGMFFERQSNILVINIKSEPKSNPLRCNIDISSMKIRLSLSMRW
jgi:Fe2+ transport system protein FeoA